MLPQPRPSKSTCIDSAAYTSAVQSSQTESFEVDHVTSKESDETFIVSPREDSKVDRPTTSVPEDTTALDAHSQSTVSEMRDAGSECDPGSSTDKDVLARIGSTFLDSTSQADGCEPGAPPKAHHRSHRRRNAIEGSRSIPPIVKRAQLPSKTPVPTSPPPASLNAPEFSCVPGNPVQSPPIRSVSAPAQARPPQPNLIDLASKIVGNDACPGYSGRQELNSCAKSLVKDGKAAAGSRPSINLAAGVELHAPMARVSTSTERPRIASGSPSWQASEQPPTSTPSSLHAMNTTANAAPLMFIKGNRLRSQTMALEGLAWALAHSYWERTKLRPQGPLLPRDPALNRPHPESLATPRLLPLAGLPSDEVESLKTQLAASEAFVKQLTKEKFEAVDTSRELWLEIKGLLEEHAQWLEERRVLIGKLWLLDEAEATPGLLPSSEGVGFAGSNQTLPQTHPPLLSPIDITRSHRNLETEVTVGQPAASGCARSEPLVSEVDIKYDDALEQIGSIFLASTPADDHDGCDPGNALSPASTPTAPYLPAIDPASSSLAYLSPSRAHRRSLKCRNAIDGSQFGQPAVSDRAYSEPLVSEVDTIDDDILARIGSISLVSTPVDDHVGAFVALHLLCLRQFLFPRPLWSLYFIPTNDL